jgi:hypothetical protein
MREARKAFLLRINGELWRELESWAQEDFRSVNGQIEFLLREAVRRRGREAAGEMEQPSGNSSPAPSASAPSTQETGGPDLEVGLHD